MSRRISESFRNGVLRKIDNFFDAACEGITKPDFQVIFADVVNHYKTPSGIHPVFLGTRYTDIEVRYKGECWGVGLDNPDNYRQPNDGQWHGDITIELDKLANPPAEVLKFCTQYINLKEAGRDFKDAARTALQEATTKRALERLPELEKFLQ